MDLYTKLPFEVRQTITEMRAVVETLKKGPYWRLIRGDKPIGWQMLAIPILWSVVLAANNVIQALWWSCFFTFAAFIMRSAGCIINDMADRNIDNQVHRTTARPLASGELTGQQAFRALLMLLMIALVMLLFLPSAAATIAVASIIPISVYPFMKRFTNYPQIFLGLTFNLGIFVAWLTLQPRLAYVPIFLYLCAAAWQVAYDTIYAHQDKKDDMRLGLGSMAIVWDEKTKDMIWRIYLSIVVALSMLGFSYNLGVLFYPLLLLGLYQLNWQVETLDINDSENCHRRFVSNLDFGLIILAAFILGRL
ncbi:MAG: 4-hydroxybenzoate octaprenyltransferase [Proteobacteria bacterium]|nr:4-hydroxybenzoate octaprenyltransferase [Pseudomonadota bacterium]